MKMRLINSKQLNELQKVTTNLRNICIVAHVDHGKTTLADSLIASNGIISPRMAGKLRYMDSRPDEQERGITMKSSSISLYYAEGEGEKYLINLIDSPGHVDFSTEVSTAVRLCDGAIVVVDVVEGVSPQTRVALKQAYSEDIKPVLILNKIDRLIVEMKLTPLDAYIHLSQVLEQVNAVMGELFTSEVLEKEDRDNVKHENDDSKHQADPDAVYDWTSGLEEADDSTLYFSPQDGNVVFASAIDGWGFTIETFAKMFSEKLGVKAELLQKVLWGDFYLNSKTKRFLRGAQEKAKKPLFVQVVLDNLWALYENVVIRNDREKISVIADKLGIKLTARDLRHTDTKIQLQSLMTQWLPLSNSVLDMIVRKLPSPKEISVQKVEKLMCSNVRDFEMHHPKTQKLKDDFLACDASTDRPVIVFISKMFPVDRRSLPENKPRILTPEEMSKRREIARQKHADKQLQLSQPENGKVFESKIVETEKPVEVDLDEDVFVAFARIFSGTLKRGSKVYVLGPKHDPSQVIDIEHFIVDPSLTLKDLQSNQHITCTEITQIYLLMGRELEELEEAVAGNIIGIGGLEDHVLKTATLSSVLYCPSFSEMKYAAVPIVRVAVETQHPADLPKLVRGLKLLNQADPSVQVLLQETGEHVLITAGEVHLERCLEDLKNRYAKVPISVSEPIVPFRETIVEPPKMDMVNEEIETPMTTDKKEENKSVTMQTPSKQCVIKIKAIPLPANVTALLEEHCELLKVIHTHVKVLQSQAQRGIEDLKNITLSDKVYYSGSSTKVNTVITERVIKSIQSLKDDLTKAFDKAGPEWTNIVEKIWSAGPRNCGPNLLLNLTDMETKFFDYDRVLPEDKRREYESSFINGFQLATLAGPLCEEPMMGVAFCVQEWTLQNDNEDGNATTQPYGPLSGQIMSAMKEGCRKAFQTQPQRLVAAMYSCDVLVNQQVLGKLYAVLGRRHGRIRGGDLTQGSAYFRVSATLPVAESFRFAAELRTHTSGLASPQLLFSHWEVIDIDPFWTPSTEEEYLHFGEKADSVNRALAYRDAVRRRKGLHVADKLVESAEKQRTLSKNK